MSAVICIHTVKAQREAQTRAEAAQHQARLAEALRDADEVCMRAIHEGDVETARDALAALICDASAPEHMPPDVAAWRRRQILARAAALVDLEAGIRDMATLAEIERD